MDERKVSIEYGSEDAIWQRARRLAGMTFRDVLALGIHPDGVAREYNSRRYKGGMGNLFEERFFGYRANSDREPDFAEAGVELKATCADRLKNGRLSAGERLVLSMIAYDEPVADSLYESHLWHKCGRMLLVWYLREREHSEIIADERLDEIRTVALMRRAWGEGYVRETGTAVLGILPRGSGGSLFSRAPTGLAANLERVVERLKAFFGRFHEIVGMPGGAIEERGV